MREDDPFAEPYILSGDEIRPDLTDDDPLQVRQHFYLQAMLLLANAEGREGKYDLWHAANAFGRCDLLRDALVAVGTPDAMKDEADVDMFVMGVARPHHHNNHSERWLSAIRQVEPKAAQIIRDAAFSFLTAWTHRYGGIEGDMTTDGRLIDPSRAPGR